MQDVPGPDFSIPAPSAEVIYLLLVFGLFIVPKMLQRYRIPSAVTSLVLGAAIGIGLHSFADDQVLKLFSTLGIVALFLFAGLDVDFEELKEARGVLVEHLAIQLGLLALVTGLLTMTFVPSPRAALLVALAVVTPSTGFILDSLPAFGLSEREQFWIKSKAVGTEVVALVVLFVALQSRTTIQLVTATATLLGLLVLVPVLFRFFARVILPFAPKSEFAFLVIVALVCAFVTRHLGVYYLVGAFLVGVIAHQFRRELPSLTSDTMIQSVEVFASFFVPFYFFGAGLHVSARDLTLAALFGAIALVAVVQPLRLLSVVVHRRVSLHEDWKATARVATPLLPTLVFTLVLAEIVRDEAFPTPQWLFGALTIYAVVGTLIPGFMFGRPVPDPDLLAPPAMAVPVAPATGDADLLAGADEPPPAGGAPVSAEPKRSPAAGPQTPPPAPPPEPPARG
ncbi:MAG: cation:proton antiporter [Gemmatimonadota bacterium]|nr:cation:proton antiporter [Gemmatimonadota bacterium]